MVPMTWWEKFLDETISRSTLYVLLFTGVIAFVDLSQNQQIALLGVATLALGASGVKTWANASKAKAMIMTEGPATSMTTTTTETKATGGGGGVDEVPK